MPSIILGGKSHSFAIFVIIDITSCKFFMLFLAVRKDSFTFASTCSPRFPQNSAFRVSLFYLYYGQNRKVHSETTIYRGTNCCYGISDNVLESWLHSIVYVRNICAHHSRLWNKNLRIQPVAPKSTSFPFLVNPSPTNRVYYILSIILYLLQVINPQNTFASRIKFLLMEFPQIDISAMGFPKDWETELLWN